jgi:hypothetical protein
MYACPRCNKDIEGALTYTFVLLQNCSLRKKLQFIKQYQLQSDFVIEAYIDQHHNNSLETFSSHSYLPLSSRTLTAFVRARVLITMKPIILTYQDAQDYNMH